MGGSTNYVLPNHPRPANPPWGSRNLLLGYEGVLAGDEEAGVSREGGNTWHLQLREVKFCPWCGVASLVRDDDFNPASGAKQKPCPSFLCNACGKGFTVNTSPRAQYAQRMIADDRRNKY